MSNIEPTEITRTMRCPRCQRTDTHTIDRSIAGEPVACWPCSGEGHRVACVVVEAPIEPTEEQMQAAAAFVARHGEQNEVIDSGGQARLEWSPTHTVDDIARLLAEREAKLREEHVAFFHKELDGWTDTNEALRAEVRYLRARVAELTKENDALRVQAINKGDGADRQRYQHLADIKALHQFLGDHEEEEGIWIPRSEFKDVPCRKYLAHYDDAKAAAPECPKCQEGTHPFYDVEFIPLPPALFPPVCPKCQEGTHPFYDVAQTRWLCDRCHHPAGEPFAHADTEGGEG